MKLYLMQDRQNLGIQENIEERRGAKGQQQEPGAYGENQPGGNLR